MNRSKVAQPPHVHSQRQTHVCVVDPKAADYAEWAAVAETSNCELRIVASAAEALRLTRTRAVDLWIVNTELPGLSGCELCGMLRASNCNTPVFLVADEYAPEIEQAAWRARATMFGVKGNCLAWMQTWLNSEKNRSRHSSATQQDGKPTADRTRSYRSTSFR